MRSTAHPFKYPRGACRGRCESRDITASGVWYRPPCGCYQPAPAPRKRRAQGEGAPAGDGDAALGPRRADYGDITDDGRPRPGQGF